METFSCLYSNNKITLPNSIFGNLNIKKDDLISISISAAEGILFGINLLGFDYKRKITKSKSFTFNDETLSKYKIENGSILELKLITQDLVKITVLKKKDLSDQHPIYQPNVINGDLVPPGWLCQSFTSNPDHRQYYNSGKRASLLFKDILKRNNYNIEKCKAIFDFGCGAGRVLTHMNKISDATLHGVDLHKEAIDWSKKYISDGDFSYSSQHPPLPKIKNNKFDFIYAISVFTHLDESTQDAWLKEMHRIASKDSILVFSYRGLDFIENIIEPKSADLAKELKTSLEKNKGFVYVDHANWKGVFPSFYADAYHTNEYITEKWGKHFEILEFIPSGSFSNRQNAVVLKKKK